MQRVERELKMALALLVKAEDMLDQTDNSWALEPMIFVVSMAAMNIRSALEMWKLWKEEPCES